MDSVSYIDFAEDIGHITDDLYGTIIWLWILVRSGSTFGLYITIYVS